ncbi:hypothetical protein C8R45DRAFT_1088778 [Mycena sanguinolenta]|nr:hypothetical protein C8R45DRAFT_1088778 [Mycena sanguinolenta]
MSVQELRERIAELDTEIDLRRELLKKLERDKILVQRQLNHVLDPIARLPLEISSQIFLLCLATFHMHGARVPRILRHICTAWADIALYPRSMGHNSYQFPVRQQSQKTLAGLARTRSLSSSPPSGDMGTS